jgi:hypothetical protein
MISGAAMGVRAEEPVSSIRSSLLLAALVSLMVTGCSDSVGVENGKSLDGGTQSAGVVEFDHATVGQEWWFSLPVVTNTSAKPIRITKAEVLDVPPGLKVIGYGAYSLEDTQGIPLLAPSDDPFIPEFNRLKDHSQRGFTVSSKAPSEIFHVAHLKVTGKIQTNGKRCRFEYEQDSKKYAQTLSCEFKLRVK